MKTMLKIAVALAALAAVDRIEANTTFNVQNGGLENYNNLKVDLTYHSGGVGSIKLVPTSDPFNTIKQTVYTVCTDVSGQVQFSNYTFADPAVFNNQNGISPTWGQGNQGFAVNTAWGSLDSTQQASAKAAVNAAADLFYKHSGVLINGTQTQKTALQLAVWEALYDTGATTPYSYNLLDRTSRFSASDTSNAAIVQANTWLGLIDHTALYTGYLLIPDPRDQPSGIYAQEFFYNVTPVPEPTTVLAGALLLLPFGVITLRKMRNNRIV